jgi:flagellar basal body-associated protein FliL
MYGFIFCNCFEGETSAAVKAAEREMAIALSARKDALLEKLKEKTDELRNICIQEAVSLN